MSILKKLFGRHDEPVKRVRICVECGMPVDDHKDWCSIQRAREAMQQHQLRPADSEG